MEEVERILPPDTEVAAPPSVIRVPEGPDVAAAVAPGDGRPRPLMPREASTDG